MQGQIENGQIGNNQKTNMGKNGKDPEVNGSSTEAPELNIKKAKI